MAPCGNHKRHCASKPRALVAACPGWNSRLAARRISRFLDRELRSTGLSSAQVGLLAQIATIADDTLGALARRTGLEQSTLSRNLHTLERAGLIEIAVVEADLRRRAVWLTEAGARQLEAILPLWRTASGRARPPAGARTRPSARRSGGNAGRGVNSAPFQVLMSSFPVPPLTLALLPAAWCVASEGWLVVIETIRPEASVTVVEIEPSGLVTVAVVSPVAVAWAVPPALPDPPEACAPPFAPMPDSNEDANDAPAPIPAIALMTSTSCCGHAVQVSVNGALRTPS